MCVCGYYPNDCSLVVFGSRCGGGETDSKPILDQSTSFLILNRLLMSSKVSFTIRRPTPVSRAASSGADSDSGSSFKVPFLPRHLPNQNDSTPGSPLARSTTSSPKPASRGSAYYGRDPDSSDEDDKFQDELVTGFDQFGIQRCVSISSHLQQSQLTTVPLINSSRSLQKKTKPRGPLVIPALQNRDWRELARKRRSATQYVPSSAKVETGRDGSVGGLGVRDTINSGPVLVGLQAKEREIDVKQEDIEMEERSDSAEGVKMEADEETEDQRALRAILAGSDGVNNNGPIIDIIPTPVSEADAYKQDVEELPDMATLEDYARVPVSQFGAALLRGMGWKEGTAASRRAGNGMIQPYLPEARPALLGIGAKEREVLDDGGGTKKRGSTNQRPERRYIPVVKKERAGAEVTVEREKGGTPGSGSGSGGWEKRRERSGSPKRGNGSAPVSRKSSRSPDRHRDYDDRRNDLRQREWDRRKGDSDRDRPRERRRDRSRESSTRRRD